MRTDQLSLDEQPAFERLAAGLILIGAAVGVLAIPFAGVTGVSSPAVVAVVIAIAVLGASSLRGNEQTLGRGTRVLAVCAAALIGGCFDSVTAMAVAMGAAGGLAIAGTADGARPQVGVAAGVLGTLWALWAVPAVSRLFPQLPLPLRSVGEGVLTGIFFGAGLLLLHLRVHADAVSARLERVGGETGVRLERLWGRCGRALRLAPSAARREVLGLLEGQVREAERLAGHLLTTSARLVAADRHEAQAQVQTLRDEVSRTTDGVTRARLAGAVASLSDSLEALDQMERKRERLDAELKLKLATLERAALALETAQGEPAELKTLVLRLSQPAAA